MQKPLSEDEVQAEVKKMVLFIQQEAQEKKNEILVRANEEFNIEKARLIRTEHINIVSVYEKKRRELSATNRIQQSMFFNRAKIQRQQAIDSQLSKIFTVCLERLKEFQTQKETYHLFIKKLMLQSAYFLMDDSGITIHGRMQDLDVIKQSIEEVEKTFMEKIGSPLKIYVEADSGLSAESAGGIIAYSKNKKILCNNTLEKRLELLFSRVLPRIRHEVFG